ncbi:MAG: HepT-like ribonuclease domain-containing protein [Actinomycetota bacterium]
MRRDLLLLGEMIDSATEAVALVAGADLETLAADRQRSDALLWNFTVLGEAAAQLDAGIKARFPEVPWTQPARLRNRIIHGYWSIDLEILHTTATDLLPGFVRQLQQVLEAVEKEEGGRERL